MLNIGETIQEGFFGICIALDGVIYGLINTIYKIFMSLAGARILNSNLFNEIANKIYIIVGVVMLFVLSYALLRGIINPDGGKNGASAPNIIKSVVIAVLGLALTPTIFNLLYQAQDVFVSNDVLGRIIFRNLEETADFGSQPLRVPSKDAGNPDLVLNINENNEVKYNQEIKNMGGSMASTQIWKAFFRPADNDVSPSDIHAIDADKLVDPASKLGWMAIVGAVVGVAIAGVITVVTEGAASPLLVGAAGVLSGVTGATATGATVDGINEIYDSLTDEDITLEFAYNQTAAGIPGSFDYYSMFIRNFLGIDKNGNDLEAKDGQPSQRVTYLWGISGIAGIFALYAFFSFSIDMAVRAAKLAYYQIIAPIPLILQMLPSFKSNFTKYLKSVMSTFAEVFIRISVVYIVVYLISHISDVGQLSFAEKAGLNSIETAFAVAILIIGLILFARQAPKIICDTFGIQSGSLNFGIGKKLADGGALTAGAMLGSGIAGLARNGAHAFVGKDKWKDRNTNRVTFGSVAGNLGRGLRSMAAGSISGMARAGYGARRAQNFGDVRKAVSDANQKVIQNRDAREARNEKYRQDLKHHNYGVFTDPIAGIKGHAMDAGLSIAGWATAETTQAYSERLNTAQKLLDSYNNIAAEASKVLDKDVNKSKKITYGIDPTVTFNKSKVNSSIRAAIGNEFDAFDNFTLAAIKSKMEAAQATGSATLNNGNTLNYEQMKELYNTYRYQLQCRVADQALKTEEHYAALDNQARDALHAVHQAATTFRTELSNSSNASIIESANNLAKKEAATLGVAATTLTGNLDEMDLLQTDDTFGLKNLTTAINDEMTKIHAESERRRRRENSHNNASNNGNGRS